MRFERTVPGSSPGIPSNINSSMWFEMPFEPIFIGMHYLIYKITNRLDNKFYVGKHKTENKDDGYLGSGILIERAVAKHGKENFMKEILFELSTEDEMNQKEADIVDEDFVARDDTYNLKLGGTGGWDYVNDNNLSTGRKKSKSEFSQMGKLGSSSLWKTYESDPELYRAFQEKISIKCRRYFATNQHPWKGRHHSDESKEVMRRKKLGMYDGEKNPSFGTMWITDGTSSMKIKRNDPIPFGFRRGRV